MTWQEFERIIRDTARFRWDCEPVAETIAGVKCDCVLKPSAEEWVVVEITQEKSINKVRDDIIKINTVKMKCHSEDIVCRGYVVMEKTPTDSMRQAGNDAKVKVVSAEEFRNEYFEYSRYVYARKLKPFGSLIDVETGQPENNVYINVSYSNAKNGKEFYVDDVIKQLKKGKRIVLKGDFGLGKSRCIKQIFDLITEDTSRNLYAIAINLREHWGAKRATEILSRHFLDLGMEDKNFIKTYDQIQAIYLLDGFDEIGTQSWSSDVNRMKHIRQMSVCALKELIEKTKGGILITGREYYFNSDQELLSCLGLKEEQTIFLECHNEFSDSELLDFINHNTHEDAKSKLNVRKWTELPEWFPKRPLVIQLLMRYAVDIFSVDYSLDDICGFWYAFLNKICEREAKIYAALNPEVIKNILLKLGEKTRLCANNTGPITQSDLSEAFESVVGISPSDESAIMLQRLPSIGRVSSDTSDRQFLDGFILNGLRAESIIQYSKSLDNSILQKEWIHPLDDTGLCILSEYIGKDEKRLGLFLSIAKKAANSANKILAADIISAICLLNKNEIDFEDLLIDGAYFISLSFEGKEIRRLSVSNSIIERIDFANSGMDESVRIEKCSITTVYGIASRKSLPNQMKECDVQYYEMLDTTTLIKRANLSESQKLFVEIIRKIFFQKGAGRKEAALLRGMGESTNKQLGKKILSKLQEEGLITKIKGDEGAIYKPVRSKTQRMDKILSDLTLSEDPLWKKVSEMS